MLIVIPLIVRMLMIFFLSLYRYEILLNAVVILVLYSLSRLKNDVVNK